MNAFKGLQFGGSCYRVSHESAGTADITFREAVGLLVVFTRKAYTDNKIKYNKCTYNIVGRFVLKLMVW